MAIEFTCPACGGTLRIRDEAIGRVVRCGGCLSTLRVPESPAPAPTDSAGPPAFPGAEPFPSPPRPTAPRPAPSPAPAPAPTGTLLTEPESSEAPRRSRSFWVLVTLGSLVFGTFACCG